MALTLTVIINQVSLISFSPILLAENMGEDPQSTFVVTQIFHLQLQRETQMIQYCKETAHLPYRPRLLSADYKLFIHLLPSLTTQQTT